MQKNRHFKKYLIILISFLFVLVPSQTHVTYVKAETSKSVIQEKFLVEAKASMLIDADSEQILQQQNEKEPLPVLSASKLLAVFVVFDEIKSGKLKMDDKVVISNNIAELSKDTFFSNVPLVAGKSYTVKELLSGTLVVSGNGAIAALAEKISGNEKAFVDRMREKAKQLDMKNTFIFTSTGLSTSDIAQYGISIGEIGSNQMSARDGAILCVELLKKHPEIIEFTKQSSINFPETDTNSKQITYKNVNGMLPKLNDSLFYKGVQGLKTGSSDEENTATFFGYYNEGGKKLITIVIGAKTKESRFTETAKLLDFATKKLKYKAALDDKSKVSAQQLALVKGEEDKIELTTKEVAGVYTDQDKITFSAEFKPNKKYYREYNKAFSAPIEASASVGEMTVKIENVSFLRDQNTTKIVKVNMISKKEYKEAKNSYTQDIKDFITNIFQ